MAQRTQIYLTEAQRKALDEVRRREGGSLADHIRRAVDSYLTDRAPDAEEALAATFGSLPDLDVPSRDEWDRG